MMNLLTSREEQIFETNHSDNGDEQEEDRAFQSSLDGEPLLFDQYVMLPLLRTTASTDRLCNIIDCSTEHT